MRRSTLLLALPFLAFAVPAAAKLVLPKPTPPAEVVPVGDRVPMEVMTVVPSDSGPVAVLRERAGSRMMPVWIGDAEARAIRLALNGETFPRPLTHDLLGGVITALGGTLVEVEVTDLVDNTFIGTAIVRTERGEVRRIDARPSDLMALALRTDAPIYVVRSVLEEAKLDPKTVETTGIE